MKRRTTRKRFRRKCFGSACRTATGYEKALALVRKKHAGQGDKAGTEYVTAHLIPVAKMAYRNKESMTVVIAALLHDILEDTDATEEELRAVSPDEVVSAVIALTRRPDKAHLTYIRRVKEDPIACRVRRCDLASSMDLIRSPDLTEEDRQRLIRYAQLMKE